MDDFPNSLPEPVFPVGPARAPGNRKPSSPDAVVAAVKERILEGRYLPGQRLLEADLCEEFGLSRGPVREAMTRLAGEGVTIAGPGRGSYVRSLSRTEAFDLQDVLEVLIGLAARLAAVRCRYEPNRSRFTAAYERLMSRIAEGDSVQVSMERTRFYDTLFEVAGNPELTRAHPAIAAQIIRAQVFPFVAQSDRNEQYEDYQPLYQAIMDGDAAKAVSIVESHLERSRVHARHLPDAAFRAP
jgi:DNA-binding GntR family transcriptional regulator